MIIAPSGPSGVVSPLFCYDTYIRIPPWDFFLIFFDFFWGAFAKKREPRSLGTWEVRSQKIGPWKLHFFILQILILCGGRELSRIERKKEKKGGEWMGDIYHADALTYALIACTGSPSCILSSSVALALLNSNSATCFGEDNKKTRFFVSTVAC